MNVSGEFSTTTDADNAGMNESTVNISSDSTATNRLKAHTAALLRRHTLLLGIGLLVLAVLLVWLLVLAVQAANTANRARQAQERDSARVLLLTRLACQDATLSGWAPVECIPYTAVNTSDNNYGTGASGTSIP